ncbi:hypothetical protein OH76DRAFT_357913, partial [Lentinus brumalis]
LGKVPNEVGKGRYGLICQITCVPSQPVQIYGQTVAWLSVLHHHLCPIREQSLWDFARVSYGLWGIGGLWVSPLHQLGNGKILWGFRGYGLSGAWVKRVSTVVCIA